MSERLDFQTDYWNQTGPSKSFAHPVNVDQLRRWISPIHRILDYGCGYGRALGVLHSAGFTNLIGVDPARAMIAAARQNFPSIEFEVLENYQQVNLPSGSIDAVLLFAVLTSVPTNEGQRAIVSEITRLLRPNGLLYVSDMFLQTDSRNVDRYLIGAEKYGIYGVFDLPDGATVRHHERTWIETLTSNYEPLSLEEILVHTMNGNPATAFQWIGRRTSQPDSQPAH